MVGWGMVAIATMYSHTGDNDSGNLPQGGEGTSEGNMLRAIKARDLLGCLPVDETRLAAHGHSMGAFITAQLVGTLPHEFAAASHTAGGVNEEGAATRPDAAARIVAPYQIHHGSSD